MQRYRIAYTETSRADLMAIGDYLRENASALVATRFVERIIATVERLDRNPQRHRARHELGGIRVTGVAKYLIFYRVDEDVVTVVRVLHGSRRTTARMLSEP